MIRVKLGFLNGIIVDFDCSKNGRRGGLYLFWSHSWQISL